MALIICPECGKKYSDQAAACPECGCPTEVIMKSLIRNVTVSDQKTAAEKAMKHAIEESKAIYDSANRSFDADSNTVQRMASGSMDLFASSTLGNVREIASKAAEACRELYITLQRQVEILDAVCRPHLNSNPDGSIIEQVWSLIREMNSDSEIDNNFSASINSNSFGNIAGAKFLPSVENKIIEDFWRTQYLESEYGKRKEEEKRIKRELDKQAEDGKFEKFKSEYDAFLAKTDEIEVRVEDEYKKEIEKFKNEGLFKCNSEKERIQFLLSHNNAIIEDATVQLKQVKALNFSEKKRLNTIINDTNRVIKDLQNEIEKIDAEYSVLINSIDQDKQGKLSEIRARLFEELDCPQATTINMLEYVILKFLADGVKHSTSEILENALGLDNFSNRRISQQLRMMCSQGKIRSEEFYYKTYYYV